MVVGYMPFGCTYFPILCHYQVFEIPLLTSQMSTNTDWQYMYLCAAVCYVALGHLLLADVHTVTVIHSVHLLFTEVQIKMVNCLC